MKHTSKIITLAMALFLPQGVKAFSKNGITYTTDGSHSDVSNAIGDAKDGDVITIPAGTFTWGANGSFISLIKRVTIRGAGRDSTIIRMSPTGLTGTDSVIRFYAPGVIENFTVIGFHEVTPFSMAGDDGWRLSNIKYEHNNSWAYFALIFSTNGVINNCEVSSAGGGVELIFGRGRNDSWQTPSNLGNEAAVYIEDCVFHGPGYVCDANSNARFVVRYCRINGPMKVDGHGLASNGSPPRGVRSLEVYGNHWTSISESAWWPSVELRGGTGVIFNNVVDDNTFEGRGYIRFIDYGSVQSLPNFNNQYQTPYDYPISDQIGVGIDPKRAASEPAYVWSNLKGGSRLVPGGWATIPQGAIDRYRSQTGNPTATFTLRDIIKSDRDYFEDVSNFNGSSGIGRGTRVQMESIKASRAGVGFWVTDEGEWNAANSGSDGQLYVWTGSLWSLKYTPYSYPHPLRAMTVPAAETPAAPSALNIKSP